MHNHERSADRAAIRRAALGLVIAACLASAKSAAGASQLDLYIGVRPTEIQTQILIDTALEHGIKRLIPSIVGGDGSVIWVTDKEDYFPALQPALSAGYDTLADLIDKAHAVGIEVYPSVIVNAGGRIVQDNPQWQSLDRFGTPTGVEHFEAMSFAYSGARQAKIDLMMDLVNGYDIDGVYLDYTRYFEGFGYEQPTIDETINTYGFDPRNVAPPGSPLIPGSTQYQQFAGLRAQTVTDFVAEFQQAIDQSGNDARLGTLADHRFNMFWDPIHQGRDFPTWAQTGLIDDVFLANYTETPINQIRSVVQTVRAAVGQNVTLLSTLTTWENHLTSEAEFFEATAEGLVGGADNVWIYREDFLAANQLWDAAKTTSDKIDLLLNLHDSTNQLVSGQPASIASGWDLSGTPMANQGALLLQDNTQTGGGQTGNYTTPAKSGLMVNGVNDYAIEFRVRPLDNLDPSLANALNLHVSWYDDVQSYNVTIDLDTDDAGGGTTGAIKYGTQFSDVITGIDWSTPHTVTIAYHSNDSNFYFYLDGDLVDYIADAAAVLGGFDPALQDRVVFGDSSFNGTDVAAEWYFLDVFNIAQNLLLGDANHDGQVTGADLIAVQQNFGNTGPMDGQLLGDANGDGQVTGADLIAVQQNFGSAGNAPLAPVPEPATVGLICLVAVVILNCKRRDDAMNLVYMFTMLTFFRRRSGS